ncbi:MAG: DUF1028 domain-containing protein [Candidatus Dormibacteria bacterium]
MTPPRYSTFSIVAADPAAGECGVAVASRFLSVGAVVPWAAAGVGAIATQSYANTTYGPLGLAMLESGLGPDEVVARLTADDPEAAKRQVGIVDLRGGSATHTGSDCFAWAGGRTAPYMAVQGNILVGETTVDAMAEAFESATGNLAARLLAALGAGDATGGDSRGRQSAALLVVRPAGGYGGFNDRYLDLRVDDHSDPVPELGRLLDLWRLYFEKPTPAELVPIEGEVARELRLILARLGFDPGPGDGWDGAAQRSFLTLCEMENLEDRLRDDGQTDQAVLRYLRSRG